MKTPLPGLTLAGGFSRRGFLGTALGAPLAATGAPRAGAIGAEIRRRAALHLPQRYLVVDYYRIRRRLAYALPVESLSVPSVQAPTIPEYPWAIWMLWALEERVYSLGWAAEWFKDGACARAAARDLEALTGWPKYCQLRQPDLASAHAGRLLWVANTRWRWLSAPLREKIHAACARHVDEMASWVDKYYGSLREKRDFLALSSPHSKLHNIPLIATAGAALAATVAAHPAAPSLSARASAVMGAILDLRSNGLTEAVAYDGYILDFIADWLEVASDAQRREVLDHPNLKDYLEQSCLLGAPGAMQEVATLSDVEPREMPFHFSAQAKLARRLPDPVRSWYLAQWPLDWIRADALAAMRALPAGARAAAPDAGAKSTRYAAVLRSGWGREDLAVAISCSTSPMGHLQRDNGTVMIGTRGRWMISDPGYQQYMKDDEREFTLGPAAHNCPVINGAAQSEKAGRLLALERLGPDLLHARVDLTRCYPSSPLLESVTRDVWQIGRTGVVVADHIAARRLDRPKYHWHGHPEAAWWFRDGWFLVHLGDADLWFTSPQASLSQECIQRLPGSRGQLTAVVVTKDFATRVFWWAFALAAAPPAIETAGGGRSVHFLGKTLRLD